MHGFKNPSRLILTAALAGALAACAHVRKEEIPATANPAEQISRVDAEVNSAYTKQYDVLAEEEFSKARKWLDRAKNDMRDGRRQQKVLDDIGYARAYMVRAGNLAENRRPQVQGILDAREAAVNEGARNFPPERARIKDLDDDFRSLVKGRIDPQEFNELQSNYMDLELASIQETQLANAIAKVNGARRDGAAKNVPNVLKQAEFDIANAKNVVAANRRNPLGYKAAVDKADRSAQLVVDVLAASKRPGKDLSEDVALDLVVQGRQIRGLKGQLSDAEQQAAQLNKNLSRKDKELSEAEAAKNLDRALEEARKEFNQNEAEVYRQGDKLLIRLKAMNFPIGRADLPSDALPLLAKVKGIAEELHPSQVVVQGHTDSTGGNDLNMRLSENRAQAVATYFSSNGIERGKIQAVGEGYKAPIASNKTKAGRAQNRRVDVIITPSGTRQPAAEEPSEGQEDTM